MEVTVVCTELTVPTAFLVAAGKGSAWMPGIISASTGVCVMLDMFESDDLENNTNLGSPCVFL